MRDGVLIGFIFWAVLLAATLYALLKQGEIRR